MRSWHPASQGELWGHVLWGKGSCREKKGSDGGHQLWSTGAQCWGTSSPSVRQVPGLSSWRLDWVLAAIPLADRLPWSEQSSLLSARKLAGCSSQIELEPLQNDSPL